MEKRADERRGGSGGAAAKQGAGEGLSLERYAVIAAHVAHFRRAHEAEVLRRLRVPRKDWEDARARWTAAMAEELEEQRTTTTLAFGGPFLKERERLRAENATLDAIGPDETPPASEPAAATPSAPLPTPAPTEPAAPPVVAAVPASAPPGEDAAPALVMPTFLRTLAEPAPAPLVAAAPTPVPLPVSQPEKAPRFEGTILDIGYAAELSAPVPFAKGSSGEEAIVRAKEHAAQVQPAATSANAPTFGETTGIDLEALKRDVLVFDSPKPTVRPGSQPEPTRTTGAAATAAPISGAAAPAGAPSATVAPAFGATTDIDLAAIKRDALIFDASKPAAPAAPAKTLTLEQYASLTVELASAPANAAEVLRRYGLTPVEKADLDARWQARFASQASLRQSYEQACQSYRAWLARTRGAPK